MSAPLEARAASDPFARDVLSPDAPASEARRPERQAAKSRLADLLPRVLSGLALMALALAAWWFGGDIFLVIWLAATIAVFVEWQSITGGGQKSARLFIGTLVLVAIAGLTSRLDFTLASLCLTAGTGLIAALASPGHRLWASGGLLYAGALIGSLSLLSTDSAYGARAVLWLFAVVWGTDVWAYFGGRLLGGPKIWPQISPGKTWSGTLIGLGCGGALGAFVGSKGLPDAAIWPIFGLSLVTAAVAQAGDMFESWMKRRFGVKDSGHLIPGHGGLMDRLDGFIAAAFFAVMVGILHGGTSLAAGLFVWH